MMKLFLLLLMPMVTGVAWAGIADETYVTSITNALNASKEDVINKTNTLSPESTDAQYPSARAVTTALSAKVSVTGDETINGVKTFSEAPIVPTPALPNE